MNNNEKIDFLINAFLEEKFITDITIPKDYTKKRELLRGLMNIRPPIPYNEELIKVQDSLLTYETIQKKIVNLKEIKSTNKISLWKGDITRLKIDAIVNAANNKLLGCRDPNHMCIDNEIHSASGIQLRDDCNKIIEKQGHLEKIGLVKITKGYNLPCKYIIHTVGPNITDKLTKYQCEQLVNCYKSCLDTLLENKLSSIAFPCISTGAFNFPNDKAATIAIKTINEYLDYNQIEHIIFNVFTDKDYSIYNNKLEKILK
ncbi:MAG: protein-ADP-ribose hydrolase [Methanobacteriaceae archaeon]|nr:protein-ADP-ribose hydrolase [Methanobacteriaceae archaeon]